MLRDATDRHQPLAKDDIAVFARVDMDTPDDVGIEVIDGCSGYKIV